MKTATLLLPATMWPATMWLTAGLAALTLLAPPAQAWGWTNDPWNGMVSVCDAPGEQNYERICQLSRGRTLIAWDDIAANPYRICYQILNAAGQELLPHNGIPIILSDENVLWTADYSFPGILPDGGDGCIAAFRKGSLGNYDIYGQRIDSLGNRLWGDNGLPLAVWPIADDIYATDLVFDSLGNFFVGWYVGWPNADVYVQKFDASGQRLWGDYGMPVCTCGNNQYNIRLVPDNQGGVEAMWIDERFGMMNPRLYFQHLDVSGNPLLALYGIPVRDQLGSMIGGTDYLKGVSDGQGGGIWYSLAGNVPNIFCLLRVNGMGRTLWCWVTCANYQRGAGSMLRHPDGTYWLSMGENRPAGWGCFLYHFDVSGNQMFGYQGLRMGGYLVLTSDGVISSLPVTNTHVVAERALRVDSSGTVSWTSNYAMSQGYYFYVYTNASDGADGVVYPFEDQRDSLDWQNISAQRVNADGTLGTPNKIRPNPNKTIETQPGETPQFFLAQAGPVIIELFDVLGRKIVSRDEGYLQPGPYTVQTEKWELPSGVYLVKLTSGETVQIKKIVIAR